MLEYHQSKVLGKLFENDDLEENFNFFAKIIWKNNLKLQLSFGPTIKPSINPSKQPTIQIISIHFL